jgi:hypothetical protein
MYSTGSLRPLATVCGMSYVIAKRCTEPFVAWLSMVSSGSQTWTTFDDRRRISGAAWRR